MCIGMRNGSFSRYYNICSPIHFLNSLCKIIGFFVFLFMSIMCSSFSVLCSLLIILLFLIEISNVNFSKYFDILLRMKLFYFSIFVCCLFFFNFYDSIIIVSRLCLCILYLFVLLYTTTTNELISGLVLFLKPLSYIGVPIVKISIKVCLFLNFIPYFFIEYDRVSNLNGKKFLNLFEYVYVFNLVCNRLKRQYAVINYNYFFNSRVYDFRFHFSDFYIICCHIIILMFVLIKEVVL